jgi:hypothetical protein
MVVSPSLLLFSRSALLSISTRRWLLLDTPELQRSCTEDAKTRCDQPDLEHFPQRLILFCENHSPQVRRHRVKQGRGTVPTHPPTDPVGQPIDLLAIRPAYTTCNTVCI